MYRKRGREKAVGWPWEGTWVAERKVRGKREGKRGGKNGSQYGRGNIFRLVLNLFLFNINGGGEREKTPIGRGMGAKRGAIFLRVRA